LSPELYYPGRILMAEHQVMSWLPTHHSHKRDFVSHPNVGVDRAARIHSTSAAPRLMRNTLPALAFNYSAH